MSGLPRRAPDRPSLGPAVPLGATTALGLAWRFAFRAADTDARRLEDGWSERESARGLERYDQDEVEGWLQLASERRPDVGDRSLLCKRSADREEHLALHLRQRADKDVGRQRVCFEEPEQDTPEKAVLVLRSLCPCGYQVRDVVPTRREGAPRGEPLRVSAVLHEGLPPVEVLADVVQEDVEARTVAPGGPVAGGRIEHDVNIVRYVCICSQECTDRIVHVLEHPCIVGHRRRFRNLSPGRPIGHPEVPDRAQWGDAAGPTVSRGRPASRPDRSRPEAGTWGAASGKAPVRRDRPTGRPPSPCTGHRCVHRE